MRDRSVRPRRRLGVGDVASYGLIVGAVVLGWQMAIQPLLQRAPTEVAIRLAPGSPLVLRRAAEAELAAGRVDNAAALSRDALVRSPFDVRALRVLGLTVARSGQEERASEILTLAGNWSLRDDPAHAWLVERRLRRGDYASAFAHADTLVRRRQDIQPHVFRLFTVAAVEDRARALPVVAGLLANRAPWRQAYLDSLYAANEGLPVAADLAILLQSSRVPLTTGELSQFYVAALNKGQIDMVKAVRSRLNRPPAGTAVTNGAFDDLNAPEPFQWSLVPQAGVAAAIMADDGSRVNSALRVEYDGYSAAVMARQWTFLTPGRYRLSVDARIEVGDPAGRMAWTVSCAPGGDTLIAMPAVPATSARNDGWAASTAAFSVPANCPGQWLDLRGRPLDRRAPMAVWFDRVSIVPLDPAED